MITASRSSSVTASTPIARMIRPLSGAMHQRFARFLRRGVALINQYSLGEFVGNCIYVAEVERNASLMGMA